MNIGNYNTGSSGHRDDFMFCVVSYVLPGSPYSKVFLFACFYDCLLILFQIWIAVHQKYVPKLVKILQKSPKYSSCRAPFLHKDSICDLELIMEEAKIPFYVAQCKPGYMAIVLPAAWHQVYNPGPNVADAVNFICHRWEVAALREYFTCCKFDVKYYSHTNMWKPLVKYVENNESAMGKQWKKKLQQMLENGPSNLFELEPSTLIFQESQDLFAENQTSNDVMDPKIADLMDPSNETIQHEDTLRSELEENISPLAAPSRPLTRQMLQQIEGEYMQNPPPARSTAWVHESQQPVVIDLTEAVPDADEDSPPSPKKRKISNKATKKNAQNSPVSSADTTTTYSSKSRESSTETPLDAVNRILQNRTINEKRKKSKKKYDEKRRGTRKTGQTRSKYQKQYGDRVRYRRCEMKKIDQILQDHYDGIVILSSSDYTKFQTTLAKHNTILRAAEHQHKLHRALKLAFGERLIQHKNLQGYVSFEIARDYIDGRDPDSRLLFKTAIEQVDSSNSAFWADVTANEDAWNRTFMVDKDFRIPAHFYD